IATQTFSVSQDIYCKSRYDFVNNRPVSNIGYRYGSASVSTYIAGNLFYVPMGNFGAISAQYTMSKENNANLDGEVYSVYLFKWTDNVVQDSMVEAGELTLIGSNTLYHSSQDTSGQYFEQNFVNVTGVPGITPMDTGAAWYLVAVELNNTCFLGYDGQTNYLPRTFLRNHATGADQFSEFFQINYTSNLIDLVAEQPNALISNFAFDGTRLTANESIDSASFTKQKVGMVAYIVIKITHHPLSTKEVKQKTAVITAYPSPTASTISFDVTTLIPSKELEYTVFSVLGQRM